MRRVGSRATRACLWALVVAVCGLAILASVWLGYELLRQRQYTERGALYRPLPPLPLPTDKQYGANVSLEQYTDQDLPRALARVSEAGFTRVRQRFSWAEIEPRPGEYDWTLCDRLIGETARQGLNIIAVLETSPAWARSPADRDNPYAPPQFVTTYGLFVRAFAERYHEQIACYQMWDQPNIWPYWGAGPISPSSYVRLLRVASVEARRADADAIVLSAGLAPNVERGGRNMSEVLFLRGMYQAGAKGHFDVLGAKAYGFWSGPEDRRVDLQVLNLSRLILLREEMVRQGDGNVPIWAVEFGWNAVPTDWPGRPALWGTDDAAKQADRTVRAVQRARQEWAWLGVICAMHLQPAVPAVDPLWGFALLGPDSEPTALYRAWEEATRAPPIPAKTANTGFYVQLASLLAVAIIASILLLLSWRRSGWGILLRGLGARYVAAPEWIQWLLFGLLLGTWYLVPWAGPALAALALAGTVVYLRLDMGLAYLVFCIPFFLYPKVILGKSFSMAETLTLLCFAAWLWREAAGLRRRISEIRSGDNHRGALPGKPATSLPVVTRLWQQCRAWSGSLKALDWATMAFVLLAALSLFVSINRGVSIREFRVIIIEPVLLYFLLRQSNLSEKQRLRLVDALLLAGVAVSVLGLCQYFVSGDVIVTEGVRRIRGVYASPNNLSLFLGRVIPLAISALLAGSAGRRRAYALALLPLGVCQFLTYSRGGWLLALPVALLTIGWLRGRRTMIVAVTVGVVCLLALMPLLGRQRLTSLFDWEQGTTFRRLRLWQAAVAMVRDHPLTGVGLDNFLYQYPSYMLSDAWQEPDLSHPHNIVLDYWTRLGIGGVAILLWLEATFFALATRMYRRLPEGDARAIILGLMASMAATLAHGLIDNSYFLVDLAFVFFLTLGWVRAAGRESEASA